jgi:hypothetical protein
VILCEHEETVVSCEIDCYSSLAEAKAVSSAESESFINDMTVSVAMCTYNGAKFIMKQLESIVRQSVLPDELVVCDDRSQDETVRLLELFSETSPFPVRIFRNLETLRPAQNFARCLSLCNGDLLILTDQDDIWFEDRIANTMNAFAADLKLTFTFSDSPLIDHDDAGLGRTIYSSLPIPSADRKLLDVGRSLLPVLMRWGVLYGTTMATRSSLRSVFLPIPEHWSHDEWLALTLSAVGPSKRLPPVTRYRQHSDQQVGTGDWSISTHVGLAQKHNSKHYQSELLRCENALTTIQGNKELAMTLAPLLQKKAQFLRRRIRIQNGSLGELHSLIRLASQGEYARYASGLKSPLKDLLMLLRRSTRRSTE